MSDELKTLKSIEQKLDRLLKWTKFAGVQQLRTNLTQNLTTDTEMLIYELSDGERTTREIARLAGVGSNATIVNYWKKWSKVGIVEPSEKRRGRYQRICSLEEVGLTVPPMLQTGETPIETEQPIEEVTNEQAEP
ncbi:MAG: hypothetical protein NWE91_08650 [Candidatus Bathyarchaeota archaeon]|nr:hypothetical protein [Candidatus Bathyarchaeota archaeon]